MGIAQIFTKKKIVDIQESNDHFDREYSQRLAQTKTGEQLADFLEDYEEFLPEGLQRFRNVPRKIQKQLLDQKDRFLEHARRGQSLAEPTEAAVLFAPPMVSMPRTMALTLMAEAAKRGKPVRITWGQAFLKLANEGMIQKLIRTQERMYKKVIDLKQYINEHLDTDWNPDEENKK